MSQVRSGAEESVVSVWIARFDTVEAADAYFDTSFGRGKGSDFPLCRFVADCGIRDYDERRLEYRFEEAGERPVEELLDDCAFSDSYLDEVVRVVHLRGIRRVRGVVLYFDHAHEPPAQPPPPERPLRFLGNFVYDTTASIGRRIPLRKASERCGFSLEATLLVARALLQESRRRRMVRGDIEPGAAVSARQLCASVLRHAESRFGHRAAEVLKRHFGITSSEDVGRIVYEGLIPENLATAHAGDSREQFDGVFRF